VTLQAMNEDAYHIIVTGRVQGVGFRYYTKRKADKLFLKGWVQNLGDGSVEIFVEGAVEGINAFMEWCHYGPSSAEVKKLDYSKSNPEEFTDFLIRR